MRLLFYRHSQLYLLNQFFKLVLLVCKSTNVLFFESSNALLCVSFVVLLFFVAGIEEECEYSVFAFDLSTSYFHCPFDV